METTNNNIAESHITGLKGILKVFPTKDRFISYPFIISLVSTLLLFILLAFSNKTVYDILVFFKSQILSIFPNILGFNLGGYALIVGFGNTELIKQLTKNKDAKKPGVFQKLNGVFAFTLILQAFVFIYAFFINLFMQLEIRTINNTLGWVLNYLALFIISLLGIWGILIMFTLIKNVFSFGQLHHFKLTLDRIKDEQKASDEVE